MGRPPLKPDDETKRVTIAVPAAWLTRLEQWRAKQPGLPGMSEAIRRLVEAGLATGKKGKRK